jgi:hypothetical protein
VNTLTGNSSFQTQDVGKTSSLSPDKPGEVFLMGLFIPLVSSGFLETGNDLPENSFKNNF